MTEEQSREILTLEQRTNGWSFAAQLRTQTVTMQTVQVAAFNNSQHTCGLSNWVVGVTQSTLGTTCLRPDTVSDLLKVTGDDLFRALDEVLNPSVISGTTLSAKGYHRLN